MDPISVIITVLFMLSLGTSAGFMVLRNLYYICQPSEILIFAGSTSKTDDKRTIGYRLIKGGSAIRTPLLEKAFRMDLTNMIIELKVTNAYSKGGIPLKVEGVANIKIAGEEPTIHNAIERLLGKSRKEIERFAKETLEGNLRGVLASLTPEQVNEDKIAFAKSLLDEAEDDLEKLGLILDNLQIQNISDDVSYLDSIGRKQQADLMRDARIAEAQAHAESVMKSAENEKITALRRIDRDIAIAQAQAELRVKDALTKREAIVAEVEAEISSEVVKRKAEVSVQTERIKQVEQQLQADVVAPAEAACKKAIAEAKGEAASIIEDGKAKVEGIKSLAQSWQNAGTSAREIFLFQKLDTLLKTLVKAVPEVNVQNVTVIDAKDGNTVAKMASFMEQLRQATGMDLVNVVNNISSKSSEVTPLPSQKPVDHSESENLQKKTPIVSKKPVTSDSFTFNPSSHAENRKETVQNSFQTPSIPIVDPALKVEIKQQLDKLALNSASNDLAQRYIHQMIKSSPTLKQRLERVLEVGGQEALNDVFDHPLINVSTSMVVAWLKDIVI
jgi:flotillin